jgi:hypothetical protein
MKNLRKSLFIILALLAFGTTTWAQPADINYIDANGNPATRPSLSCYSLDNHIAGATGDLTIGMDNQETPPKMSPLLSLPLS